MFNISISIRDIKILYLVSLDALDGWSARVFNQNSKLGGMLDLLTDMCTTTCLQATLCTFYPRATFVLQISMIINITSHWLHLHTSLLQVNEQACKVQMLFFFNLHWWIWCFVTQAIYFDFLVNWWTYPKA